MTDSNSTPTPGTKAPSPAAMAKKPGPRPGAAAKTVTPAPLPAREPSDPSKFGRVDDEGNVFLTRGGEERQIGSWQAGTPAEGLAHYGQRYDDLVTEVELIETRLRAHPEDADALRKSAEALKASLADAAVIGDIDAVEARLDKAIDASDTAREKAKEQKAQRREQAIARKEALAAEAEDLAENSTEWKAAGDRIRAILEEWRGIRGIDRATDDELWKRYSRARDSFNRRRGSHFAELDRNRAQARKTKEELVERAEALKDSTDWGHTARAYRDLMTEWKAAGRAPREVDDKLWERFRAAQDHFFEARNAVNAERDREFEANAEAKDALISEYDSLIDPAKGLGTAKAKLRELQDKWDEIGFVPRGRVREFEDKIGRIEQRVSEAEDSRWRKTDPAQQDKVNQFQVKADDFTKQAEAAEAKGDAAKAASLREQAKQWQEFADVAAKAVNEG
ncbi:DNA repair ATPase [Corynebacterium sp. HMSC034A01]|nr:DNA repair ATPase [Corynebacterium sp. HMSC034A01]